MRYFQALHKDGTTEDYPAYEVDEFPIENVSRETLKGKYKKVYAKAIATFDIETTTYVHDDIHEGFMYIWQFCIDGICIYGRTWEQFILLLQTLNSYFNEQTLVIYVHNLSFEFTFIQQLLQNMYSEIEVFAPQPRKPLTVRCSNAIEFRCSYKLSNMSLEKATLNEFGCDYIKAAGDLDYSVYRDKNTPLDDKEFGYAMMDVLSLYHYIKAKLLNDGDTLSSIPLTSTGYVRRDCRRACKNSKKYMQQYMKMKLSEPVYKLMEEAGRGGDTGANRYLSGHIINDVDSYDVKSSYPYQLLTQKFPMSRFYKYGTTATIEELEHICTTDAVIFKIAFEKLRAKPEAIDLYFSYSKRVGESGEIEVCNGRVLKAESIIFTITEVDWEIVKDSYLWDKIAISEVWHAKKGYLPIEIRNVILEYFDIKCHLEIEVEENPQENSRYLYMKSKNKLNGIFGMMYTNPVRDLITVNTEGAWNKDKPNIIKALKKFYNNKNNFLCYPWGIWTTAHARYHLHKLINIIGERSIYWDTDSDKGIVSRETRLKIEQENEKIKKICEERHAYVDINGRRFYLGIYEHDGHYENFKTLGAKKYAYTDHKGFHITISGVSKAGATEMKSIEKFDAGFIFKDHAGLTLYYNRQPWGYKDINGVRHLTGNNVGTENTTYKLGITDTYAEQIGYSILTEDNTM